VLLASLKRKIGEEKQLKLHFRNADRDFSTRISADERSLGSCDACGKRARTEACELSCFYLK